MKISPALLTILLALALANSARAECFADYKAKSIEADALQLHYGVAEFEAPCTPEAALAALTPRLTAAGWELLKIVDVFDETGLAERKDGAGNFYLRF